MCYLIAFAKGISPYCLLTKLIEAMVQLPHRRYAFLSPAHLDLWH